MLTITYITIAVLLMTSLLLKIYNQIVLTFISCIIVVVVEVVILVALVVVVIVVETNN